ncbi:MAG: DMT family transporter [Firmicutes bacterium]|nr:DMT family transporter [Bacillota bacterium]
MGKTIDGVSRWKLYTVGIAFTLSIGFSFFGIKQCVPYADTLTLLAYRFATALIGVIMFVAVCKALGKYPKAEPNRPKAKLYQTAGFYLAFMVLQILAMYFATSIEGAIVFAVVPIFAKIIGRITLGEKSTPLQNFFVVLTVAALVVLIILNATDIRLNVTGLIIMTISSIFMGCQNVSARYVRGVFAPIEITVCISVGGFIIFYGAALLRALGTHDLYGLVEPLTHPRFVIWVSFLGIFCILLSAQFMAFMLAHMELVQCTVFSSASTLVSIIAGALILGEPLYWYHYICGALILTGVIGLAVAPAEPSNSGKSLRDDMIIQ